MNYSFILSYFPQLVVHSAHKVNAKPVWQSLDHVRDTLGPVYTCKRHRVPRVRRLASHEHVGRFIICWVACKIPTKICNCVSFYVCFRVMWQLYPFILSEYVSSITNFWKEMNKSVVQRINIIVYAYATDKLNTLKVPSQLRWRFRFWARKRKLLGKRGAVTWFPWYFRRSFHKT